MFVVFRALPAQREKLFRYHFTRFHSTLDKAYIEAKRLADKHHSLFMVLEVVGEVLGENPKEKFKDSRKDIS